MDTIPAPAVCRFVGEGRANVVFSLTGVDDHPNLRGQLLRVPKHKYKALPYVDLQRYWETRVSPLFGPHELVQQRLVRLPCDKTFFKLLNEQLRRLEESGSRRRDFVGHVVSETVELGMLVEDMRAEAAATRKDGVAIMHEIKPKWLAQSPRAPRNAEQCRNCAREVWRNMKDKTRKQVFCPLNLVKAADFPDDPAVAADIATALRRCYDMPDAEARNLTGWLRTCAVFQKLRKVQWENDHDGHVTDDDGYSLAMTLRDCSLLVLVPSRSGAPPAEVVGKLGDTDMKNFAVKKEYWMNMEKEFHDNGVYMRNTNSLASAITDCQLPFYRARRDLSEELRRYYVGT
ncbi:hypothetical protein M406DRAFT_66926 [Cryphonectria parasitica EP155]|uniref:Inositol-pentakisphosphate 2-kinase n=1 Tax=Cryphonectria parasitica (strain ATCC 38755 / EP155) TaxID=660469 RepID=A0A9P5CUM3_CRYP1|nr:uncharacterized protein M406DRAFT_66926 [Cryphonectria parasitica EP155]KAF3770526.1 hypothetical protein M406DRAFT_66926 [Cryphonectria parasitica EP155]